MLRRLHFLREAIGGLQGANEIDCTSPTDLQWDVLENVQQTLMAPAEVQQVLEGESYITGSLAPFDIYKIRCGYKEAIEDDSTNESVKYLANILLKDLDERYHPTECRKVQYFRKPETGFRSRYISLHPYMFFAAFLDPRTKVKLTVMMSNANYKDLLGDILDNMISINEQNPNNSNDGNNADHERINERASDRGSRTKKRKKSPSIGVVNFDLGIPLSPFQSRYVSQSNSLGEFIFKPPEKFPKLHYPPSLSLSTQIFSNKKINFTSPSSHRPRSWLDIPRSAKSLGYCII